MRISQINILKNYSVSSNKNNIRPTFINFKGIEDSFQSSLKDVKPSKAFLSAVEDKNQQEKIIRELLLDDKGNYDTKMERLFVRTLASAESKLGDIKDYAGDNYSSIIADSTLEVLKYLKDNQDNISVTQDEMDSFVDVTFILLTKGLDKRDIKRLYDISNDDGEMNISIASFVGTYMISRSEKVSPDEAYFDVVKYCLNEDKQSLNASNIIKLANILNIAHADSQADTAFIAGLISNKDSVIDDDKYRFVCGVMKELFSVAQEEIDDFSINYNTFLFFKGLIYKILQVSIEREENAANGFSAENAIKNFNDWYKYSQTPLQYLNENIYLGLDIKNGVSTEEKIIPISETDKYLQNENQKRFFTSSLYKLYYLLNAGNPNEKTIH